jgi:hypothetical protein
MCCFSQPVDLVCDTNIFARGVNGRQFLVYSMAYAAAADLAMVLPLPVPPNPPEDAVRFINLERYPTFFDDLRNGFPVMVATSSLSWGEPSLGDNPKLQVHDVGSFEASFVPRIEDFDRLDERFRIPRDVWGRIPAYHNYGFAVFKLKGTDSRRPAGWLRRLTGAGGGGRPKPRQVHPMAFEFPRRYPYLLYFPTLHVHDRKVHPNALFDHMLYCQPDPAMEEHVKRWQQSDKQASAFMDMDRTEGIVAPNQYCWRRSLTGRLENTDTLVGHEGSIP